MAIAPGRREQRRERFVFAPTRGGRLSGPFCMRRRIRMEPLGSTGQRALAAIQLLARGAGFSDVVTTSSCPPTSVSRAIVAARDLRRPVPENQWPSVVAALARVGAQLPDCDDIGGCCRALLNAARARAWTIAKPRERNLA